MHQKASKQTARKSQSKSTAVNGISLQDNRTSTIQRKANKTGLPDKLKTGIEQLSGHSMDDVKVHYNSSKPAQLNAHAYAQGNQIHLASGQEKHLPHEAWHVVQQKQGRVRPTMQMNGTSINDNKGLEREADTMGARAFQLKSKDSSGLKSSSPTGQTAQLAKITITKGNIIDSVPNENFGKHPAATERRGQISGGRSHSGGTPGTPYAKNVTTWTRISDWKGGHVYKHQWGGGTTRGNIVVWPNDAENKWEKGFENPVQARINAGLRTAIGVSWTIDNEMVKGRDLTAPDQSKTGDSAAKHSHLISSMEVDRRTANSALSYVPTLVAGHYESTSFLVPSAVTHWDVARRAAIDYIQKRIAINAGKYDKDHTKPFFARRKDDIRDKLAEHPKLDSAVRDKEALHDEIGGIGSFGNFKIEHER